MAVRSGDPDTIGQRPYEPCRHYCIAHRIAQPIIPGDNRTLNTWIVEALANEGC